MSIPREIWLAAREDYIRGKGSLRSIALRHGLNKATVEKRAKAENWTGLRREFEAAQMAKIIPPPPPMLPPVPVAPDGTVSDQWMGLRVELYYRRNTELLDKVRALLDAKLTASEKPSADELGKLTSALSALVSAEIALLGLNRRKAKPSRRTPSPMPCPVVPEPVPTDGAAQS